MENDYGLVDGILAAVPILIGVVIGLVAEYKFLLVERFMEWRRS